jgi:disulfide oxidoreductase YuzD
MNDKQQTAVEWLLNAIETKNGEEFSSYYSEFIEQAKEMEKQQIAKAFDDGDYNYHYSRKTGNDFEDGQEYYQEVYG